MNLKDIAFYIALDERKIKFIPYSSSEKFFMLDYETMNKAVALGSKYALNDKNKIGKYHDDTHIYYYEILNEDNFGIIDVYEIKEVTEDIYERDKI